MSDEEVVREAIGNDLGEYEIQEPLEALSRILSDRDLLRNRVHVLQAQLDDTAADRDSLRAALERLAMVDPLYEAELPFINASRELEARMAFAREALDSNR